MFFLFLRKTGVCATMKKLRIVPGPLKPQPHRRGHEPRTPRPRPSPTEHPYLFLAQFPPCFMTIRVRRSTARSGHLVLLHLPALSATNTRPTKQSAAPAQPGQCHCSTLSKPSATEGPQQCEEAHRAVSTSTADRAECDEDGYPALSALAT